MPTNAGDAGSITVLGRSPGGGNGNLFLPGKSCGQRRLVDDSPCGHKSKFERLHLANPTKSQEGALKYTHKHTHTHTHTQMAWM